MNLLLVLSFPDDGTDYADVDPEIVADSIVACLNEDRRRNAEDAGRPGYYRPLMVNAIPCPQWLDGMGMRALMNAARQAKS